jgi:hypothetical protein
MPSLSSCNSVDSQRVSLDLLLGNFLLFQGFSYKKGKGMEDFLYTSPTFPALPLRNLEEVPRVVLPAEASMQR